MRVSLAKLKALLDVDEPDYPKLARIAADAMPHLRTLAASDDPAVASKAVSLAGVIADTESVAVVGRGARSRNPLVRVAAAHAAIRLPDTPQGARVVSRLLDDADIGVMKVAARAAARQSDPAVASKARRITGRLAAAVRTARQRHVQRERAAAMATKTSKKTGRRATRGKRTRTAAGQMPTGAMTEPPKGAKARSMPTGKMS